ncbi:Uncharacterized protein HZ326_21706 [Fusarium oxysporum f. sp. albedinis]|nr:Uncharacterized protein HZ326_21706 [Fusarium oxysporum f. sp. albedinis]
MNGRYRHLPRPSDWLDWLRERPSWASSSVSWTKGTQNRLSFELWQLFWRCIYRFSDHDICRRWRALTHCNGNNVLTIISISSSDPVSCV